MNWSSLAIHVAYAVARIDRRHRAQPTRVPVRYGGRPVRTMSTRRCVLIAGAAIVSVLLVIALGAIR